MKALSRQKRAAWFAPTVAMLAALTCSVSVWAQDEEEPNEVELVTPNSEWKYNDSGQDLGTAWREKAYNDADWKSGNAPLGYGDSGMNTEVSFGDDGQNKIITQYYRKRFSAESPGQFVSMILRVQRDDGIAVYINGFEILRDNLPPKAAYDTVADASIDGSNERAWVETAKTTASLVAGENANLIAVEVHQSSGSSSDTRFDCELKISDAAPDYGEVRVGIQTQFTEVGWGNEAFFRDPLADPPEIEMNWESRSSGNQFALTTDIEIVGDEEDIIHPVTGDFDVQFFIWDATLSNWTSEKIDTRNYNNVRARVGVRTRDEDNGFDNRDYFRGKVEVSTDGNKFTKLDWFELKGGGTKPIEWTELINDETPKFAAVPTSATEPPADWMDPGFEHGEWQTGTMGVGYETGSGYEDFIGIDVKETMRGVNSTCYIRIPFTAENVADASDLQLRIRYDDGYVAFLNGKEVNRENAPAGAIAWDELATSTHSDLRAVVFEDVDIKDALNTTTVAEAINEGENILTIIGLNTPVGSSDFLIDVALRIGEPGEGITDSLDALNFGAENRLTKLETPVGLIPDSAASMRVRFEAKTNDFDGEVIYFDDVRTFGDPIAADSYFAYMQLETGWSLDDPRIEPNEDPDGDSISNLLEYAFASQPHVASQTTVVKGEEVPILPVWDVDRRGFASVSYRQISAPLAKDGRNANDGYHVQDLRYLAQITRGDLDDDGVWIWTDGSAGGVPVYENRQGKFEENEDGTVQVELDGLRGLSDEDLTFVRLLVRIVGFEQVDN